MYDDVRRLGDRLTGALGELDETDATDAKMTGFAADAVDHAARQLRLHVTSPESFRELGRVLAMNNAIRHADSTAFRDLGFYQGKYVAAKAEALAVMRRVARDSVNRERV